MHDGEIWDSLQNSTIIPQFLLKRRSSCCSSFLCAALVSQTNLTLIDWKKKFFLRTLANSTQALRNVKCISSFLQIRPPERNYFCTPPAWPLWQKKKAKHETYLGNKTFPLLLGINTWWYIITVKLLKCKHTICLPQTFQTPSFIGGTTCKLLQSSFFVATPFLFGSIDVSIIIQLLFTP